jgi:hypothetical protein
MMTEDQRLNHTREKHYPWATDDQWACVLMLMEQYGGEHHFPSEVKPAGSGIKMSAYAQPFATFDFSNLTRLVFLAHDRCIRVQLCASAPGRIGLMLHRRKRVGDIVERHPTLETAVAEWRAKHSEGSVV